MLNLIPRGTEHVLKNVRYPQLGNHSCMEMSKNEITIDKDLKDGIKMEILINKKDMY